MVEWIQLLSNFGVGGGLAFLFAWYLIKSLIPSLAQVNEKQRNAFLDALREQRAEFLSTLKEIRLSQEKFSKEISSSLSGLTDELSMTSRIMTSLFGKGNRSQ